MTLYQLLADNQAPTSFDRGDEMAFYNRYSYKLSDNEPFAYLSKMVDSFGIIRANIVLRAIMNKEEIEKEFFAHSKLLEKNPQLTPMKEFMDNVASTLPYLEVGGEKIYVPIFPSSLASIYTNSYEKLSVPPYKKLLKDYEAALIDPFDYYGPALYDSYFTKLVIIRKTEKSMAAYDYDAECIYFINEEGRLDAKIALFDKGLTKPLKNHMIPRIRKVVDAYYENDRDKMLNVLLKEKLISDALRKKADEKKK